MKISNILVEHGRFRYRVAFSEGTGKILVVARKTRDGSGEVFLDPSGRAGSVGSAVVEAARKKSPLLDALRSTRQTPPMTYVVAVDPVPNQPLEVDVTMLCGHKYRATGAFCSQYRSDLAERTPTRCEICTKEEKEKKVRQGLSRFHRPGSTSYEVAIKKTLTDEDFAELSNFPRIPSLIDLTLVRQVERRLGDPDTPGKLWNLAAEGRIHMRRLLTYALQPPAKPLHRYRAPTPWPTIDNGWWEVLANDLQVAFDHFRFTRKLKIATEDLQVYTDGWKFVRQPL